MFQEFKKQNNVLKKMLELFNELGWFIEKYGQLFQKTVLLFKHTIPVCSKHSSVFLKQSSFFSIKKDASNSYSLLFVLSLPSSLLLTSVLRINSSKTQKIATKASKRDNCKSKWV